MANISYIQNPTLPTFEEWVAQLRIDLPNYDISISYTVNNWWEWANQFVLNNNLDSAIPLPTRIAYPNKEDWKKWVLFVVSSNAGFVIS